jgi:ER-bound oxygenase mpaB/B'/Rubber oxygenase, catalytic domain
MTRWTNEFLDPMRRIGDEPADQLMQEIFDGQEVGAVNSMMRNLVANEAIPPGSIPDKLREFLESEAVLPQWADEEKIKAGEELFWEHGPAIVLILFCYSLPFCYAARKEVQVLALTDRLESNPTRRITETAQMLIEVMAPGGLTGPRTGVRTVQKVRLMHAGVRHLVSNSPGWNSESERPLNQEDLAGTLMSFTSITFDGLRRLDIKVSESDAEAYLHCWKAIGHILGIQEKLVPADVADAEAFTAAFEERQFAACDEGRRMTEALLKAMAHILPGNMFDLLPRALTHYFVGPKIADLLGVQTVPFGDKLFSTLWRANLIVGDIEATPGFMRQLVALVSRQLLEALQFVARGGNRPSFNIPAELRQRWGINWCS